MTNQKIIYILDDDPEMRKALERLLSAHGYHPRSFASVADFHATASSEKALCLIADIQLNGAGIELGRQLSLTHPTLPVIFTTGSDTEGNRSAVQQVGAAGYLPKPFGSKSLLEAIQTAIGPRS